MSFVDDLFDEVLLSPICDIGSPDPRIPEPYIPLLDGLEDESIGMIPALMNETNSVMSIFESNLMAAYEGMSPLLQNPLEMQVGKQHLGNSFGLWLQDNEFLSQSLLKFYQEPSVLTRNQMEIGQLGQANNGFAHPTMPSPRIHHRQELLPPAPLIHGDRYAAFGSLDQTRSIGSQNYPRTYQTFGPVASSVNMYQQPPPFIFTGRQNGSHNIRMINNPTMPTPRPVMTSSANMYGQQPSPFIFTGGQNAPHNIRMVNNPTMRPFRMPNQANMIPIFNAAPQHNIPPIPRPQMSMSFARHSNANMQRSVSTRVSSRITFTDYLNTPVQIRPHPNSVVPPQDGAVGMLQEGFVGSKRRIYQSRFEVGESSSSARKRQKRVSRGGQNVTPAAVNLVEQRQTNNLYSPLYESLGLPVDPYLRNYSFIRTD
ncbi:uncharacterized protein LOC111832188 [Capsella rubella]|uniref:uncharacterized protein LOC111832188 n=1 Tax=Capsella rubella TaxID=81985 RepID=UPI000CD4C941|nr:uncharacterized protein LOC111832188 [Capsella rubella]